jgi:hypothetical protein
MRCPMLKLVGHMQVNATLSVMMLPVFSHHLELTMARALITVIVSHVSH